MTNISFQNDFNTVATPAQAFAGSNAISDNEMDMVVGGASWQGIVGGVAAGVGCLAATIAFAPAVATGATVGFVASMIGGSTVAAGGLGSMVGGVVDLIKGD